MKASIAKEAGYTHLGKIYGFYCYTTTDDDGSMDIHGTNWLRRRAIDFFVWIESRVYSQNGYFTIEIIHEL